MISKRQEAFRDQVARRMATMKIPQSRLATYLGVAQSSVWRKINGIHPWTAEEQEALKRLLKMEEPPEEPFPCRDDPALDAMDQMVLGLTKHKRPEIYQTVVRVARGLQDDMTPLGKEAYRILDAMIS